MTQLTLDLQPIEEIHHSPDESIDTRFARFHEANPHVYVALVKLSRQLKDAGAKKVGIGMLFERMRYEWVLITRDSSGYKLNNDYRSRYARMIMEREEDLKDLFEVRALRRGEVCAT